MRDLARNTLLILALTTSLVACESNRPPEETSAPPVEISPTCDRITDYLKSFGFAVTTDSSEPVCTVQASEMLADIQFEFDPFEGLRDSLVEAGWTEMLEFSADGAGMGSFRVVHEGAYCKVAGGAPAWIDDDNEIRQAEEYTMDVECGPEM